MTGRLPKSVLLASKNHQEPFSHLTRIGPRLRGSRGLCCRPVGALTRLDDEVDRLVVVDAVRVEGLVVLELGNARVIRFSRH